MLKEVQNIITRINDILKDNNDFETLIEHNNTVITVHTRDEEPNVYHGYELFLLEKVVNKLGKELIFSIIKGDTQRFVITTDANYNLSSYINKMNKKLKNIKHDEIGTVFICEKLSPTSHAEFNVLTCYNDGTWKRYDLSKSELLYAAVFDLELECNESGVFWYKDLIEMNNKFYDELQN